MNLKKSLWGLVLLGLTGICWGNVDIYFSTSAPADTQSTFLSNTLGVCTSTYFQPNTFFHSYDLILSSCASGVGIGTVPEPDYVYGWADGATYNQYQQVGYISTLYSPCANISTTTFLVAGSTWVYTTKIDSNTCTNVIWTMQQEIWTIIDTQPKTMNGQF